MKNELEARIEHLRRCSLTEELANKPDDFGWWVVANYGEALLFQNDKTMLKEGREYVSQLASLCAWDYDGAYSHISENFLMYLQARADRIGKEEKESDIGQFISYMIANRDYTSNYFGGSVIAEETLHTRQAEILGPLYLPLHGMSMGGSIITSGDTHKNNPLEWGPQSNRGPWPWNL